MKNLILTLCSAVALAACGTEVDDFDTDGSPLIGGPNQTFCGGIAGFTCPGSQKCLLDGNYPDAGGHCVGNDGFPGQAWVCPRIAVMCAAGYMPRSVGHCRYICQKDHLDNGACSSDAQCEQWAASQEGLVTIMCVGNWTCERGQCGYQCATSDPISF